MVLAVDCPHSHSLGRADGRDLRRLTATFKRQKFKDEEPSLMTVGEGKESGSGGERRWNRSNS